MNYERSRNLNGVTRTARSLPTATANLSAGAAEVSQGAVAVVPPPGQTGAMEGDNGNRSDRGRVRRGLVRFLSGLLVIGALSWGAMTDGWDWRVVGTLIAVAAVGWLFSFVEPD
jgi:hypothetical protein